MSGVDNPSQRYQQDSLERAIEWIFSMQCKNGGWASFDKDNTKMVFQYIPFADHNAMLDPPTVDITGRILEMLALFGYTRDDKRVQKAIDFVLSEQEGDGSWFGRWGCNYIYGTFLVLRGLEAIGFDHNEPQVLQAAEWLRMIQNPDGGWGESLWSYHDATTRGVGESTASQTAWACLGLMAAGDTRSGSLDRGIAYLLKCQKKDGSWWEKSYTGTGFPKVFYLKYHMYAEYFPLLALAAYAKLVNGNKSAVVAL
jgi:squalene-hopene/tetraprenyl-beta-curcumene cyclase